MLRRLSLYTFFCYLLNFLFINVAFNEGLFYIAQIQLIFWNSSYRVIHVKFLRAFSDGIDACNEYIGRIVSWVTLLLVIVVFVDVVMRYAFKTSFVFTQELEWQVFAFIFLMGAGYTLLRDGHVRVDIIYQKLPIKQQAWINLIGTILFLIPGCLLVIDTSWSFVLNSFAVMEGSPDPGGIPYRFIIKSVIPLGFILLLLQGISLGLRSYLIIAGVEKDYKRENAD